MHPKSEHWFFPKLEDVDTNKWQGYLRVTKSGTVRLNLLTGLDGFTILRTLFDERQILNGYLEQRTPVCLVKPYFSSYGFNAHKISAQFVLDGIHLNNIDEACFTGFSLTSKALHAVLNPNVIKAKYETSDQTSTQEISFLPNQDVNFDTSNGMQVSIRSAAWMNWRAFDVPKVKSDSHIKIIFPEPISCNVAENYVARFHYFFCFLAGKQLQLGPYKFTTNKAKVDDPRPENMAANTLYKSSLRNCPFRMGNERAFIEISKTKVSLDQIFEHIAADEDRTLTYLMDMILRSERLDGVIDDRFVELIGLLEDFHVLQFGNGTNSEEQRFNVQRKESVVRLVRQFGDKDDVSYVEGIKVSKRRHMNVVQRLEQLAEDWKKDGFRGHPDFKKIKSLRNRKPHGRGVDLSSADIQYIAYIMPYLTALARYHILKKIGFNREEIANSFLSKAHTYGQFIPRELVPK